MVVFVLQGCTHWEAETEEDTITMLGLAFEPREWEVTVGTTVTWVNEQEFDHTTTSDIGLWDSGVMGLGDEFSYTFEQIGEYPYHCEFHVEENMTGVIIVTED
jgi:plastocyanin